MLAEDMCTKSIHEKKDSATKLITFTEKSQ